MHHLLNIPAAILALISIASAVAIPSDGNSTEVEKRQGNEQVFVCDGTNWTGNCLNLYDPDNSCYNLDNGLGFYKNIASFGPAYGGACKLYYDTACNQYFGGPIGYPGSGDLGPNNWQMGSFWCIIGNPPPGW